MAEPSKDLATDEKGIRNDHKSSPPAKAQNSQGSGGQNSEQRNSSPKRQAEQGLINGHQNHKQEPRTPRTPRQSQPFGFDNSDRNPYRKNIGSCTDRVAEERKVFGPWQAPDPDRQNRLVGRLAPHKDPPPPDPKFDTWVNHFQYYWNIGVDIKSPRRPQRSAASGSQRNSTDSSDSGLSRDGRYTSSYHRLLRRPQTTPGRLGSTDSEGEHNMSSGSSGSGGRRETQSAYAGGPGRGGSNFSNDGVVSGLDRRYMGLQRVSRDELGVIVTRLSRMTSAYNAKFAPNPHVWVDQSPGAHMVKRETTIA